MRVFTLEELFRLTRVELFGLHHRIATILAQLPEDSPERLTALINLQNIRRVLARPHPSPHQGGQ